MGHMGPFFCPVADVNWFKASKASALLNGEKRKGEKWKPPNN